jgi:hypothetical protein
LDPDPATYEAPEQPYVDPGDMHYDPGQALAEESVSPYAEVDPTTQPYVDPNQAYVDPNQAYVDPATQPYVDPAAQPYVDPAQQQPYVDPAPAPASDAGVYDDAPAPAPKGHARKRVPKKKIVRRGAARVPVTGGTSPGAIPRPVPVSRGGISVMTVFLTLCAIIMLGVVTFVVLPKDLSKVAGYPATATVSGQPRNLLDESQRVMISRDKALTFTEEQVNTYLNNRLQGKQDGMMAILVKFKGVYVDFTPGYAEVIVEREFLGMPLTMSAKIKGEKFRRQVLYKPAGWTIGKIEFKSRNIKPVIEMFTRLRETLQEEYQAIKLMADVRFEEDRLVLDPT